jgi:hypothetical protein
MNPHPFDTAVIGDCFRIYGVPGATGIPVPPPGGFLVGRVMGKSINRVRVEVATRNADGTLVRGTMSQERLWDSHDISTYTQPGDSHPSWVHARLKLLVGEQCLSEPPYTLLSEIAPEGFTLPVLPP